MDDWFSRPETYDDALDAQIHRWYYDVLTDPARKVWPPRGIPYFSPSSVKADPRSLYEKLRGAKRDQGGQPPHQGRWTRIGTQIGDLIQRELLFAEKHVPGARFSFEKNPKGEPMFEDFAKTNVILTHNGKRFVLHGTGDGIMRYVSDDGEILRVGLEVKSKQGTFSRTSDFSQRNGPEEGHAKQTVCYSIMYGTPAEPLDYYVILYVNGSKKAWEMTPEDYAKNPDIAVHCIRITDEDRAEVLDRFAELVRAAEEGTPPPLDITEWTFNSYKAACAASLSDEEVRVIERQVAAINTSGMPDWKKIKVAAALADIERRREAIRCAN